MFGIKTIGKIEDVNEAVQKIIDANAEKYFLNVTIDNNGSVSIFIGSNKEEVKKS